MSKRATRRIRQFWLGQAGAQTVSEAREGLRRGLHPSISTHARPAGWLARAHTHDIHNRLHTRNQRKTNDQPTIPVGRLYLAYCRLCSECRCVCSLYIVDCTYVRERTYASVCLLCQSVSESASITQSRSGPSADLQHCSSHWSRPHSCYTLVIVQHSSKTERGIMYSYRK